MSHTAILADGLAKRYRIGELRAPRPNTLRDALSGLPRALARGWRRAAPGKETVWALDGVSFEVRQGEVLGVIGSNGAGKSTLLKVLSRITEPTAGRAEIHGRVGSLLEVGTGFHSELTGRENIYLNGAILGMRRSEIARRFDEIVEFAEVARFIDTPVKHYSSGMYLRLAFAVAAHLEPEILLVDEVLAVGDAAFQKKCLGKMEDVARHGRTILFVSHNLLAIESLCQQALWLRGGAVAAQGDVGRVVGEYLQTMAPPSTERLWEDPATAPGDDRVRLRRALVRPAGGSPQDPIDVTTPFVFEFEYWNLRPGARLNLSLHVFNQRGVLLFNAGPVAEPRPHPAGLYRDLCRVPGNLLNDGPHSAEILIVEDQSRVLLAVPDVLVFDVRDSPAQRGGWAGKWAGLVRPLLPWQSERLAEAPAGREAGGGAGR